jgi:putative glutamine amidotransferase
MKPLIAVTPSMEEDRFFLHRDNPDSILMAGGVPVVVTPLSNPDDIAGLCDRVHGLYLSGGGDVDPLWYGEEPLPGLGAVTPERDMFELELVWTFLRLDKPVFAVCRGHQLLNVAAGGTLYQDIAAQVKPSVQHRQIAPRTHLSHTVSVLADSKLYAIAQSERFRVNSFHHQAIKEVAPGFRATAWTSDGLIEAIESERHRFVIGVQWHPEHCSRVDSVSRSLFAAFVEACMAQ